MIFCEKCGKKARESATFCSGCGTSLHATDDTSERLSDLRKRNSRRKTILAIRALLLGTLFFSAINIQSIATGFNDLVNPVPEKVFIQLAKPSTNQGWLQSANLEVQLESNKSNSYQVVLEIKNGGKWESRQIMNVVFDQDDLVAKKLSFFSYKLKPGTRELRVKVLRDQGSQELVEISESVKVRILKKPEDMQIADDSNNTIIWRFAKENEKPQYCAKYKRCYFLKVASTKRCTIKATMLKPGKVVSINNASNSSIGSVAAYTHKKSYLIEVPYNAANSGSISARCFALRSGSNQGSTPAPTKKPTTPVVSYACSIIYDDLARARREEENFFIRNRGTWYGRENESWYWDILQYNREAKLNGC